MAVSNAASGGWGDCPMNWLLPRHKLEQLNSWAKGGKQIHMLLHGCTKLNDAEHISGMVLLFQKIQNAHSPLLMVTQDLSMQSCSKSTLVMI